MFCEGRALPRAIPHSCPKCAGMNGAPGTRACLVMGRMSLDWVGISFENPSSYVSFSRHFQKAEYEGRGVCAGGLDGGRLCRR